MKYSPSGDPSILGSRCHSVLFLLGVILTLQFIADACAKCVCVHAGQSHAQLRTHAYVWSRRLHVLVFAVVGCNKAAREWQPGTRPADKCGATGPLYPVNYFTIQQTIDAPRSLQRQLIYCRRVICNQWYNQCHTHKTTNLKTKDKTKLLERCLESPTNQINVTVDNTLRGEVNKAHSVTSL